MLLVSTRCGLSCGAGCGYPDVDTRVVMRGGRMRLGLCRQNADRMHAQTHARSRYKAVRGCLRQRGCTSRSRADSEQRGCLKNAANLSNAGRSCPGLMSRWKFVCSTRTSRVKLVLAGAWSRVEVVVLQRHG